MALSDEARGRFAAYVANTDPANVDPRHEEALFSFVAWALVHEPDGLADHFTYDSVMKERGFTEHKSVFVHTVIVVARPIVTAHETRTCPHVIRCEFLRDGNGRAIPLASPTETQLLRRPGTASRIDVRRRWLSASVHGIRGGAGRDR